MTAEHAWPWPERRPSQTVTEADPELTRAFARCFSGTDGERVLAHLTRTILDRRLGPDARAAELRHLEGQRCAIAYLIAMVARGRA